MEVKASYRGSTKVLSRRKGGAGPPQPQLQVGALSRGHSAGGTQHIKGCCKALEGFWDREGWVPYVSAAWLPSTLCCCSSCVPCTPRASPLCPWAGFAACAVVRGAARSPGSRPKEAPAAASSDLGALSLSQFCLTGDGAGGLCARQLPSTGSTVGLCIAHRGLPGTGGPAQKHGGAEGRGEGGPPPWVGVGGWCGAVIFCACFLQWRLKECAQ